MISRRSLPFFYLVTAALVRMSACAEEAKPPRTIEDLRQRLSQVISQPEYVGALWGVKVLSLDTDKTLFEHNPEKLLSPASNAKLYTVALGLDTLGADYRIKTSLYAKKKPAANGTLKSDLTVFGRGDPSINARHAGGDIYKTLEPFVFALTNAGIKKIKGDLVADESYFRGPEYGSGWVWDDLENSYGAEISALTFNDNTVEIKVQPGKHLGAPCQLTVAPVGNYLSFSNRTETVGTSRARTRTFYRPLGQNIIFVFGQLGLDDPGYTENLPFHRPAALFASLFKETLARYGIKVTGGLRTADWLRRETNSPDSARLIELGFVESPPLSALANAIQKPSQNLYADLLLAHVGETTRDGSTEPDVTSEELGIRALNRFLIRVGIKQGETFFEEGSGLSRDELTTPKATVALLKFMSHHKCAEAFTDALPIAGVDGTLRGRMKGTAAEGNVRAKTGSLRWARALSGYVTTAAGERLAFCFMLNRFQSRDSSPSTGLDAMAALLASFTGRSDGS